MPLQSWETASDAEYEEIQRRVLRAFGSGAPWLQKAIGSVLGVKSPAERLQAVKQREEAKVPAPTQIRETAGRGVLGGIKAVTERVVPKVQAAQEAVFNPEVPIIEHKKPGAEERFAVEFRIRLQGKKTTLLTLLDKGVIDETEAQKRWEEMPQMVMKEMAPGGKTRFGLNLSDIGLGRLMGRKVTMEDVSQLETRLGRLPMTPLLPEQAYKPVERIPVVGPKAAREFRGLTTPVGLAGMALFPEVTAGMVAGGITGYEAGKGIEAGLEKAGLPTTVQTPIGTWGPAGLLELGGTVLGPVVGPTLEKAFISGTKAVPGAVREAAPIVRRTLAEEAGGLKPRVPEEAGWQITNDIPARAEIDTRIRKVAEDLAAGKRPKAKLQEDFARLQAQQDIDNIRNLKVPLDDRMDAIKQELDTIEGEIRSRQVPFGGRAGLTQAEIRRAERGISPVTKAAITRDYPNLTASQLEVRRAVFGEFFDNMRVEAAKPGQPAPVVRPAEEPLVTRARFTETGEVVREPTFATERELAGIRPQQGVLGIGAGERPIETAGPMFAKAEPVSPGPQPVGREETLARWQTALEGGRPPTPPEPPTTVEATGGIPPESAGTRFVAPLREFDDVTAEVVTSQNPIVRALVGKTGINPSVLNDTPVGKALTAYWRQRVSGELLSETAISPALDVHAQPFTGRMGGVFTIRPTGEIKNLTVGEGQSRIWQDVFSRPDDYALRPAQRAYIDDFNTVTREVEAMRADAGLKPRALKSKEGWLYVPRQVKTIRGVELRRPSNPGLQRIYEEAQEGVAAGVDYSVSPRATLEIHVRAAYREIAEKQLADALEPLSITPKELVPEPVRIRMEQAVKGRVTAERQLRTLNREYLKTAAKGKPGWPKREAGLGEMRAGIETQKAVVETAKGQYWQAKRAYSRAMESARKAEVARGNLFGQADETIAIGQWRNRFFPREQADALNEGLGTFLKGAQKASPLARGVEILGNYTRFLASVGDFAEPFVQGLPTFAYRPVVWARSTLRHYQAFFDPTVQARFMRNHLETFQKMAQSGTPIGDPEFFAALTRGGGLSTVGNLVEMLPKGEEARRLLQLGGRQTFGRFQACYNVGMGSNRALLYESLQPTWKGTESELWQHIRNMTGGLDTRALGVGPSQRGFESMWLGFSPRLLRSTAALITDAMRPTTPQGQAALKALAGLCSAATGIYVLTGLKLGKSWEEIRTGLNPLEGKKFLAHEINGDWIGIGGQVRAIVQLVGHSISSLAPGGEPIGDFVSRNQMENPLLNFYSSRGAPAYNIVGGVVEAGTGANVLPFDQVDSLPDLLKHLGTSALPFAIQGKLEGEQWGTTAASLAGFRTQAQTVYEKRDEARDKAAQQKFGKSWADLNRGQQDEVRAAFPEVAQLEGKATETGAGRGYNYSQRTEAYQTTKDTLAQQGERLLDADPTGRQWVSWRKTVGIKLSQAWDDLTTQYGITEEPREPKLVEDQLAERYWNLEPDANNDGMISEDEGAQYDADRKAILTEAEAVGVSPDYIKTEYRGQMWPNNPRLQAIEQQYQQAKDIAAEYYSIPAKTGMPMQDQEAVRGYVSQAQSIASLYNIPFRTALNHTNIPTELLKLALKYKRVPGNPARAAFWRRNPDKKELYYQFYRDIPIEVGQSETG